MLEEITHLLSPNCAAVVGVTIKIMLRQNYRRRLSNCTNMSKDKEKNVL